MSDILLKAFPIRGLEYVFLPPGLPLIAKTPDKPPSTSILVRGGAGTGKTTLAVAISHAIAREHSGVTLYLTTEFVPTELVFKAKMLGLADGSVGAWRDGSGFPEGSILAEHLMRTKAGEELTTNADRKRAAINAVWELLEQREHALETSGPKLPVRAVVIDAFGLSEPDTEDPNLRGDLLSLVQALEMDGISTVLIEEVAAGSANWLPFIVDIVFDLELSSDPDTGELLRKLSCRKSRFAPTLPGPHDYGLDQGRPSVWANVFDSLSTHEQEDKPRGFFFPLGPDAAADDDEASAQPDQYFAGTNGLILVLSEDERSFAMPALEATPGLTMGWVRCGPLTQVTFPDGTQVTVPDREGPFSLAWTLTRAVFEKKIHAIVFWEFHYFFSRARFRTSILHALEMLRSVGAIVCIYNLGMAHEMLGKPSQAFAWYERAAEVNPCLEVAQNKLVEHGWRG